jgi:PilZ domain
MVAIGNYRSQTDLRKSPRQKFHYNAVILVEGEKQVHPCSIVDISDSGARLQFEEEFEVPERFVLLLTKGKGPRRHCEIVWRNGLFIGVKFPPPAA